MRAPLTAGAVANAARDGFVDRVLNRRCSRRLTPLFLRAGVGPNAITGLSLLVGLAAAAALLRGGWTASVGGALLLQLSVVLDCCDGEVARARGLQSRFGDRFDVLADNAVHVAVVLAIAWAAARDEGRPALAALGAVAAIGVSADAAVFLGLPPRRGHDAGRLARLVAALSNRDFSVLVLALALAGRLAWLPALVALGSHAYWLLALAVSRRRRRPAGR